MESMKDEAFEITYRLDVPVRDDIYDYIQGNKKRLCVNHYTLELTYRY